MGRSWLGTDFPSTWHFTIAKPVDDVTRWIEINLNPATDAVKNFISKYLLDPLQTVLEMSPFWLTIAGIGGLAYIVSGRRAAVAVMISLALIVLLQVWEHAMQTLTMVLVGDVLTMIVGIVLGVAAARNNVVSSILRPINDAAQTLPAFVYLVPAVALFGPTRFTAIVAAIIYAVPAVVRLVEDGMRAVSPTAIEASTSAGTSRLQMILKVQLPMARRSLLVAANQGVVLVLADRRDRRARGRRRSRLRCRCRVLAAQLLRPGDGGGDRDRPARRGPRPHHPGRRWPPLRRKRGTANCLRRPDEPALGQRIGIMQAGRPRTGPSAPSPWEGDTHRRRTA